MCYWWCLVDTVWTAPCCRWKLVPKLKYNCFIIGGFAVQGISICGTCWSEWLNSALPLRSLRSGDGLSARLKDWVVVVILTPKGHLNLDAFKWQITKDIKMGIVRWCFWMEGLQMEPGWRQALNAKHPPVINYQSLLLHCIYFCIIVLEKSTGSNIISVSLTAGEHRHSESQHN